LLGRARFARIRSSRARRDAERGAAGGLFFATDDCQASYEELKSRGVEFTQPPTEQPYGIDAGFRDQSGNHFRMAQRS
jgi:predicted enzyme related to lactoylglutathione lyase